MNDADLVNETNEWFIKDGESVKAIIIFEKYDDVIHYYNEMSEEVGKVTILGTISGRVSYNIRSLIENILRHIGRDNVTVLYTGDNSPNNLAMANMLETIPCNFARDQLNIKLQTIGPFFVHDNHFVGAIAQGCESPMVDKHIGELKMLKYKGFVEKD